MKNTTLAVSTLLFSLIASISHGATIPNSPTEVQPLEVGSAVPAAIVQTADGKDAQLTELTTGKPSVIIFYRGGWCPYCTRHLAGLGEIEPELKARGYQILALSTDNAEYTAATEAEFKVGYQLLADPQMNAAKAFGLAYKVDQPTLDKLKSYHIDIEAASGKTHHLLPVPAVYVTDANGKIIFRHFDANYKKRLPTEELLEAAL